MGFIVSDTLTSGVGKLLAYFITETQFYLSFLVNFSSALSWNFNLTPKHKYYKHLFYIYEFILSEVIIKKYVIPLDFFFLKHKAI